MNFIKNYVEKDTQFGIDMIYCDYNIVGAETGRTSASDPPMQGIIVKDTTEFRECFIARPDNLLIIADYSQQEMGILAHLAQDQKMIDIINSGENIYIGVGKEVFEKEIQKGSKEYNRMKSTVLGTDYGMSPYGLARKENISIDKAERLINKYLRTFPDVGTWVIKGKKKKNYVETVMGRRIWLNRYSHQCERNALNSPIQGTAADMTKIAVSRLHQNWNYPYPFAVVETTHDEIGLDVPKNHAQEIAEFTKEIMEGAAKEVCPSVNIKVDVEIGTNWGAKQ